MGCFQLFQFSTTNQPPDPPLILLNKKNKEGRDVLYISIHCVGLKTQLGPILTLQSFLYSKYENSMSISHQSVGTTFGCNLPCFMCVLPRKQMTPSKVSVFLSLSLPLSLTHTLSLYFLYQYKKIKSEGVKMIKRGGMGQTL